MHWSPNHMLGLGDAAIETRDVFRRDNSMTERGANEELQRCSKYVAV